MARFDIVDVETSNVYNQVLTSQKIQLGNVTKATLDTTLTGQIGLTVDQFNALSNDANQRGLKISSLFNDSSKVSGVLFSKESYYMPLTGIYANVQYKPNSVDSASFTVPTLDPAIYGTTIRVVLIESVSLTYSWYCSRICVGTTTSGYGSAEIRYQDIFLHDADFDLSRVVGLVGYWSGSATNINQSNASEKISSLFFGPGNNPSSGNILNFIRCYGFTPNSGKMTVGTSTSAGITQVIAETIKSISFVIVNNALSFYGFDFFGLQSGGAHELIVVRRNGSNKIVVSSNETVSGSPLFPSVTCDGNSGNPNIPASAILWVDLKISATSVILKINGVSLTIKKTGGVNLTETDINTAISTDTRQIFAENGDLNAATIDNYFANFCLFDRILPDDDQTMVDQLQKRYALLA